MPPREPETRPELASVRGGDSSGGAESTRDRERGKAGRGPSLRLPHRFATVAAASPVERAPRPPPERASWRFSALNGGPGLSGNELKTRLEPSMRPAAAPAARSAVGDTYLTDELAEALCAQAGRLP